MLQPTRKCRLATSLSCSPHISAGLHPRCPLILQPTSKLVATTLLTLPIALGLAIHKRSRASLLFAPKAAAQAHSTCHAASPTPVRPRAVTAMLQELAAPPRRSLPHSSIICDKDKDLDGQRHAMPLAMHVEKDLLDRFLEVCVCHTLLDC